MDKIIVAGGHALKGEVIISGAKNAALPLMAASLLTEETLILGNLPHLMDIATMANLLGHLGVNIQIDGSQKGDSAGRVIRLQAQEITKHQAPYDIVRKMRASVCVLGPLLVRHGKAQVSLPGGCAIGQRPIDMHLEGLRHMGAEIKLKEGYILAYARNGLKGAEITFDKVSVGATLNILMAATLARGKTVIHNAAEEPEITDVAHCLTKMGALIEGIGTDTLTIEGVERLSGTYHEVIPDRIEAGTFAVAAAISQGEILLHGAPTSTLSACLSKLEECGVVLEEKESGLLVKGSKEIKAVDISTQPYPGFPTDMQAQIMALMCIAKGASVIVENIFENRFMHVPELQRMGANITVKGRSAVIRGVEKLKAAQVMATDLRASVSLVLAGLVAEGDTVINRVYHIDRGYERIEEKLAKCGASIRRVTL